MELDELRYLERAADLEGGGNHGPLSGKKIIVHTPRKTASTSLVHALGEYYQAAEGWDFRRQKILHSHDNQSLVIQIRKTLPPADMAALAGRSVVRDLLRYNRLTRGPALVLSSYREPLGRALSTVFQRVQAAEYVERSMPPGSLTFRSHRDWLLGYLEKMAGGLQHPLEEIEPAFFEQHAFDHREKCCWVDRGHHRILVVCLEHSGRWSRILERKLGCRGIQVGTANTLARKDAGDRYRAFKEQLRLPAELIHEVYYAGRERKYLEWFYTEDEIAAFHAAALERYGPKPGLPPLPPAGRPAKPRRARAAKAAAAVRALRCTRASDRHALDVALRLENTGNCTWLSWPKRPGAVAVAVRGCDAAGRSVTGSWQVVPHNVEPGERIELEATLRLPPGSREGTWHIDLVRFGEYWFSARGLLSGDTACRIDPSG